MLCEVPGRHTEIVLISLQEVAVGENVLGVQFTIDALDKHAEDQLANVDESADHCEAIHETELLGTLDLI